uniref:Putative envelope protein n=1 Tax=Zaria bat coronavirus TaxID=989337 RepID=F1BYM1_9BETC|nr:putative envelope protein [Zaria bat coronavirus]
MYSFVSQEIGTLIVNIVFLIFGCVVLLIVAAATLTCLRLCGFCCNIVNQGLVRPSYYVYTKAQDLYANSRQGSELIVV